ncbi:MAG: hypothetical protein Tsb0032_18050 [Kiloniellaceae bacterium]
MTDKTYAVSSPDAPTVWPPERRLNHALRHKWRKRLFWFWIAGSALVALYLAIGGPLTAFTGLEKPHVALVVVPFLMLMLASGLAWLILLVRSRR